MNLNQTTTSAIFHLNIPLIAHIQAEKFCRYHTLSSKAQQVYLNTLAVTAVNSYLNLIGWSTNLEQSDSWNPVAQMMMDVADLMIPSYGKLECRPVLSRQETVIIPPEVWSERIGYVLVMLDKSWQKATLLGFVPQVNQTELPLSQLESLAQFPTYLCQQKRTVIHQLPVVSLSSWISGALAQGWQQLDELLAPQMAMNFRGQQQLTQSPTDLGSPEASKVKLIEVGKDIEQTIALILNIRSQNRSEFKVSIRVCNHEYNHYLPDGLELVIVDQVNCPVMIAQAREMKTIEFVFSGELGEKFSVEIGLNDEYRVERFTI